MPVYESCPHTPSRSLSSDRMRERSTADDIRPFGIHPGRRRREINVIRSKRRRRWLDGAAMSSYFFFSLSRSSNAFSRTECERRKNQEKNSGGAATLSAAEGGKRGEWWQGHVLPATQKMDHLVVHNISLRSLAPEEALFSAYIPALLFPYALCRKWRH